MDKVVPAPEPQVPPPPEDDNRQRGARHAVWTILDCLGVFALTPVVAGGLFLVGTLVAAGLGQTGGLSQGIAGILSGAVVFVVLITAALTWVRLRYPGHARDLVGRSPGWADVGIGLGLGLLGFLVINLGLGSLVELLARLAGADPPAVQEDYQKLLRNADTAPFFILMAVVLAPLAEELFFRGMLFPAFARRMGVWAAILLSALLFAVLHVGTGATGDVAPNAILAGLIFPLGVLLAWIYHRRGTLVTPIIVHAVFNLLAVVGLAAT